MASSSLLPFLILGGILLLLLASIVLMVAAGIWLNRSDSPRAVRLRQLVGGIGKRRDFGEKQFLWTGEDRVLRQKAAQELASKRGLAVDAGDSGLLSKLEPFHTVPGQSAATIENVIRWNDGEDGLTLFSYRYDTTDSYWVSTLLYVDASRLQLPPFLITGETIAHKTLFAEQDIDFDDDPEFSSRYHLESSDEAAVRRLFTAAVRRAFVAVAGCRIECIGSRLVFSSEQRTTLAALENFVDESAGLLSALAKGF